MFKLLSKSFLRLPTRFLFSEKKQHALTLTRQLLAHHQNYQPWKNVRMIHAITMSRYDPEVNSEASSTGWREDETKIEEIIESLSGDLHQMPHREINMLLEVLREKGLTYDRTLPIFKALNKQAKLFFGRQYRASELNKTLLLYKLLGFPKQTWIKMIECFLQIDQQRSKKEEHLRMNVAQYLKIVILTLEQPFVPLPITKSIIERLAKLNANNLETLTSLYHISRILPNGLKAKVEYQFTRSNVRDILFNPYSQMEAEAAKEQNESPTKSEEEEAGDSQQELKGKLTEMSNEILKLFLSTVDLAKLEQSIIKSIQSDVQPLSKQVILFSSDIVQLRPVILKYLRQNAEKLTPIEFFHLLRKAPADSAAELLRSYGQKLEKYMSIEQKVYLHLQSHRSFHSPIELEYIVSLIESISNLRYAEFMAISRLISQLPPSSQHRIPSLLSLIKSKIVE